MEENMFGEAINAIAGILGTCISNGNTILIRDSTLLRTFVFEILLLEYTHEVPLKILSKNSNFLDGT